MRKIIKRLLKKYKYPPEQASKALKNVICQAEKMCGTDFEEEIRYDKVAEGSIWIRHKLFFVMHG